MSDTLFLVYTVWFKKRHIWDFVLWHLMINWLIDCCAPGLFLAVFRDFSWWLRRPYPKVLGIEPGQGQSDVRQVPFWMYYLDSPKLWYFHDTFKAIMVFHKKINLSMLKPLNGDRQLWSKVYFFPFFFFHCYSDGWKLLDSI